MIMSDFGTKLKEIRTKRGLGVNQLGTISGVSPSLISKIENGERGIPKPGTLKKLAKGLKMDYSDLLNEAGVIEVDTGKGAENEVIEVNNEVKELMEIYRTLDESEKKIFIEVAKKFKKADD